MRPIHFKIKRFSIVSCFLILTTTVFSATAQQELHIHHINTENGEATMIGVYDTNSKQYLSKTLIDGGYATASAKLLPYIKKISGPAPTGNHFNYVILTHYHNDHYNGLSALKTGALTTDTLVDPGGYDLHQYFPNQTAFNTAAETKPDKMAVVSQWLSIIKTATSHHPVYIKAHTQALISFGTSTKTSIGHKLIVGQINGLPVTLTCVAGWGNTLGANGIVPDPLPNKPNPNNFTLSFVLACGEFRYFIGGDMGGANEDKYINQESSLISGFAKAYPQAHSYGGTQTSAGHLCGFKADHHGSVHSNNSAFMESFKPAITVTSGGDDAQWFLPQEDYINRLSLVTPLSVWTIHQPGTYNRGVYFTNLYDWEKGHNSLSKAKALFQNKPDLNFDYGNDSATAKDSYLIRVPATGLDTQSAFEVDRVDISQFQPYTKLAQYFCHKK